MTLSVYHSGLTIDNSSSAQLSHPFSRRLFHPLLARRNGHSPQQLPRPPAAPLRNPQVHGRGGE